MRRVLPLALVVGVGVSLTLARPGPVNASFGCGGSLGGAPHFAGTVEDHTNAVTGGSAKIEYVNEDLCSGTIVDGSFSSAWASVVGYDPADTHGYDIYQIGYDDCRSGCAPGSTTNVPYMAAMHRRLAAMR